MSYQVIARKYRPQRFADVVGQEHVTQTLANAIEQKRIAHAYLFCGPRGTGKTTIARIFAKCLNCSGGPRVDFADDDPRCVEITEGRALDVIEIDGASNNGVEQVRELRETCKYAPASAPYKIYIIDEVHMLSTAAFNALLKTLEEPPAHVKFLFATTDPEKVLATILSRCQRFDLRRISSPLIVKHLAHIAGLEKVTIDQAALFAIARGADGGMRDAESTLDQLISFCGDKIEEPDVLSMFGLAAENQILKLSQALLEGGIQAALGQLNEFAQGGKDLGRLLADLLNHFRNLLIFQVSRGDLNMIEVSEASAAVLKQQTLLANTESLTRVLEVLTDSEIRLRDATSKKILLEVTLLKIIEARNASSLDAVLKQLVQLRGEAGASAPAPAQEQPKRRFAPESEPVVTTPSTAVPAAPRSPLPAVAPSAPSAPAAAVPSAPRPQTPDASSHTSAPVSLDEVWKALLESVGRASPFTRSYLVEARPVSFDRGLLIIGFDPEFEDYRGLVDNARNHTLLQTKLAELGHPNSQIKFIKQEGGIVREKAPEPTAPAPAAPVPAKAAPAKPSVSTTTPPVDKAASVPFNKNDFKDDPLIKKALEVFKGQIIEVRA
jgi:DNA polymerase-3 subunit gamma/tau